MHFPAASVVGPGPWVWGEECCTHIHPHLNFLDVRQLSTDGALVTNTPTHALTITYTSSLHRIYSYGRWSCNARQTPKKSCYHSSHSHSITPSSCLGMCAWLFVCNWGKGRDVCLARTHRCKCFAARKWKFQCTKGVFCLQFLGFSSDSLFFFPFTCLRLTFCFFFAFLYCSYNLRLGLLSPASVCVCEGSWWFRFPGDLIGAWNIALPLALPRFL